MLENTPGDKAGKMKARVKVERDELGDKLVETFQIDGNRLVVRETRIDSVGIMVRSYVYHMSAEGAGKVRSGGDL